MGRRRGQKPTKNNPYIKGPSWLCRYKEYVLDEHGVERGRETCVKIGPARGRDALTKKEADREAYKRVFSRLDLYNLRPGSSMTVEQFVERRYLPSVDLTQKKSGREFKRSILSRHILPSLGKRRLRDITTDMVSQLLTHKLTKEKYTTQTVVHIRNVISSIFHLAADLNHFDGKHPTSFQWKVKMQRQERGALSEKQVMDLCDALPDLALFIQFMVVTGCRVGEACGLRWQSVNLTTEPVPVRGLTLPGGCVAIVEAWVRGEYTTVKRAASERIIPLAPTLAAGLLEWQASTPFPSPEDPVFTSSTGKPVDHHNLANRHLKPALKRLGMPLAISWHWLRHTNATMSNGAGMSPVERQKLLGHADPKMTMHYSHAALEEARAGLEEIARKIGRKRRKVVEFQKREA